MTYEGYRKDRAIDHPVGSSEWFAEIDARFFRAAFATHGPRALRTPFGRYLPPGSVADRDVLEIGCGMGTHTELLATGGARVSAIDLTPRAVELTRRRCALRGLSADVREGDAEQLPFEDESFDLVWSWGVLHHSSSFERCLAEATRVLRPGGRLSIMVYHRASLIYYIHNVLVRGILFGQRRHKSFYDIYSENMDGAYARMFSRRELADMLAADYEPASITVTGQKAELLPIPPSALKRVLEHRIPDGLAARVLNRWGFLLVAQAIRS